MDRVLVLTAVMVFAGYVAMASLRRAQQPRLALRGLTGGLVGVNVLGLAACLVAVLSAPAPVLAQNAGASQGLSGNALGAGLATGLACIGAGIGVGIAGAAAIGSITEKPEVLGRTLIFVGLAEGVAIYGLIISFMILNA